MDNTLTSLIQDARMALLFNSPSPAVVDALSGTLSALVDALSAPPADDVREFLIEAIDGCIPDDIPGYRQRYTDKAADAILALFEVRPRGKFTAEAPNHADRSL